MRISQTDPRLTSFVLGELSDAESKELQNEIDNDPELQTELEKIRQTIKQIESSMQNEPLPENKPNLITKQKSWFARSTNTFAKIAVLLLVIIAAAVPLAIYSGLLPQARNVNRHGYTSNEASVGLYDKHEYHEFDENGKQQYQQQEIGESRYKMAVNNHGVPAPSAVADNNETTSDVLIPFNRDLHNEVWSDKNKSESSRETDLNKRLEELEEKIAKKPVAKDEKSLKKVIEGRVYNDEDGIVVAGRPGPIITSSSPMPTALVDSTTRGPRDSLVSNGKESNNPAPEMTINGKEKFLNSLHSVDQKGITAENHIVAQRTFGNRTPVAPTNSTPPESNHISGNFVADTAAGQHVDAKQSEKVADKDVSETSVVQHLGKSIYDPYNSANDEAYKNFIENEFKAVKVGEFSTFSIDVDSASYSTMRRYVGDGKRPPVNSVRLEEYINYFKYEYAQPTDGKPFATHVDVSGCPWEPKHLLARIGIKGKEYSVDERPALNLVFLIDVSGSMEASNRLPLVKRGLTELVEMLQPKDRVAIVTYAGASRVALPSVSGQEKRAILDSINSLGAGGSTAGAAGIKTAYEVARKYYNKEAQNRVILCTDGDFNVGETNNKTLETMIGEEAQSGVFLTILGFGMGNYKDERLKTLSMRGNGNYGYIDSPEEARRLLVEGLTGTLFAIAKDVKIQVDFNPAKVAGYRLLGYENRKLRDEDFHNDKIDAGEIGAGHTVTALYEIVPVGVAIPAKVDKSRYEDKTPVAEDATKDDKKDDAKVDAEKSNELMFVKLRYKLPDADKSSLLEYPVSAVSKEMSGDSQFVAAVALFGMLLRESRFAGSGNFDTVLELATPNTKDNQYRKEFLELVKKAKELQK